MIKFRSDNPKQLQAAKYWIDQETEQILYGGAKYGGKTYLGCTLVFGDALIYPDTQYFIARKELIDLRKFTLPSIQEVFKHWGLSIQDYAKFNGQDNVFNLYNRSKVFLISCNEIPSDPLFERFGSMQNTRGWIEEGGEIAEAAKANLWLSVGRWKNDLYGLKKKLLITANPKKGWMKREFVEPARQGILPPTLKYIQAFATDNIHGDKEYVRSLKEEKDSVRRQRLWEGNWDYDEDQDSIVSADALEDAFSNTIVKDGDKYLVVDVARFGEDTTTFNFWDGLELYRIEQVSKQDTEQTKQKIKDYAAAERIPWSNIMVDEDGIGGAVVDGLPGVRGFVANSSALPTASEIRDRRIKIENNLIPKRNFANLKSQCAFMLAQLINEHKVAFTVPNYRYIIIEELSALLREKDITNDKKLIIKPKEDVKESLGRSPDIGDPLIYRAWFELRKIAIDEDPNQDKALSTQVARMKRNSLKVDSNQ